MRVKKVSLPKISILSTSDFDYVDSYEAEHLDTTNDLKIMDVAKAFFSSSPSWIGKLLGLRNKIVCVFGLKTGSKETPDEVLKKFKGEVGEQVGIFKVFQKSDTEMILGEDDKHLNFRVSLLLETKEESRKHLTISTIVKFNNWLGKLYFFPVRPFHKLIVPVMLKSVIKDLGVAS